MTSCVNPFHKRTQAVLTLTMIFENTMLFMSLKESFFELFGRFLPFFSVEVDIGL